MTTLSLGHLTTVDLRQVFISEAAHFTPWLAEEYNLALLGNTIGLDLELIGTEQNVGPYRADIVCKDTLTNGIVLVESQLEKTDHTHLGQILTYTAKFQAVTVVWIASRFSEEHRAAFDWLNNNTVSNINFFGLEVELWRIGNSPAAPKFNVVSKPNEWVKANSAGQINNGELTSTKQWQYEYWTAFREYILAKGHSVIRPRQALPQHWSTFAIGRSGFELQAIVHQPKQNINVSLIIQGNQEKAYFHLLKCDQVAIEEELGEPVIWHELPEKKSSYLTLYLQGVNPPNRLDWPRQHEWLLTRLESLYRTLAPRIKKLDATAWMLAQQ